MLRNQINKLPLFFVCLWFVSCTEVIDMGYTTEDEKLVVDAKIMDVDTVQYVKLTKININPDVDGIVSPISNAIVQVNNVLFSESTDSAGLYIAPDEFIGVNGQAYKLIIRNTGILGDNNNDLYEAEALMPGKIVMDSVKAQYYNMPQFGLKGYMLKCWAWDPPEQNFFLFKAWRNGVLLTDSLFEYEYSDDFVFNGNYINGANCQFLSDSKQDEYVLEGDTLELEIDNIDRPYFDYLYSAQTVYWGSNPMFGGPPANAISNISNGAMGVFRVYSPSKMATIVEVDERPEENIIEFD